MRKIISVVNRNPAQGTACTTRDWISLFLCPRGMHRSSPSKSTHGRAVCLLRCGHRNVDEVGRGICRGVDIFSKYGMLYILFLQIQMCRAITYQVKKCSVPNQTKRHGPQLVYTHVYRDVNLAPPPVVYVSTHVSAYKLVQSEQNMC